MAQPGVSHLGGVFDVDVVDELAQQPKVFFATASEGRLLLVVLHLDTGRHVTANSATSATCSLFDFSTGTVKTFLHLLEPGGGGHPVRDLGAADNHNAIAFLELTPGLELSIFWTINRLAVDVMHFGQ